MDDKYGKIRANIRAEIHRILSESAGMNADEQMDELYALDMMLGQMQSEILQHHTDLLSFLASIG
jgi:hypothetical protein